MQLSQFYQRVLKFGIEVDPRRDKKNIKDYPDTAILHGAADKQIRKIFVGIDIDVAELLLADKIRNRQGLDLVIAHHPQGKAYASFFEVMQLQVDLLTKIGLSRAVSQKFLDERMREVERRVMPANHMRSVDAARLLDLAFMCIHTPADNHASWFIQKLLSEKKLANLGEVVSALNTVPEYQKASAFSPRIILGNPKRPTGKIHVEMTGGTEGPKEIYDKLYKTGVRTLVCMHLSEEHFKKVKDVNLNVVIAGHISSDTLGLNLLLDKIEKEEKFLTVCCSGFQRISRN